MIVELRGVSKGYRTNGRFKPVLKDIDFVFPRGESVGILGKNGAGKSTLLRVIAGTDEPDTGRVVRHGRMSFPIGFKGSFNGSLTGEENCRFAARVYEQDIDYVVAFAMRFSEIGDAFFDPVRTYSSGMRARLAFGLSMAMEFDVYLVDEVTAVGDVEFKKKCRKAFQERQERSSLIMVSHNMQTLAKNCTRFAVLSDGKLALYDSVKDARKAAKQLGAA